MRKSKPTTPGRRLMTFVDNKMLSKNGPYKPLILPLKRSVGRNSQGRITTRHKGGGVKKLYRDVDFRQEKLNIPARVIAVEYDPFRSAFIDLICYKDGEYRYILAPDTLKIGDEIISSENAPLKIGNRTILVNIPVGYFVHNIELNPGSGGKIIRSAGAGGEIVAQEGRYTQIKMPSGEIRKILSLSYASIGVVSNPEWKLLNRGKAGRTRLMGIRPTVRGSAMNPRDHPYGGGEGRALRGTKRPKTKWGKIVGGVKTRRKKKSTNKFIIKRR